MARCSPGLATKRVNSVWPRAHDRYPELEAKLVLVERFYSRRGVPARYQISPASQPSGLERVLVAALFETGRPRRDPTGKRLTKHLAGSEVSLLHDRLVPEHGTANIDDIAVGPAGVLVIDSKTRRGEVRADWVGGLFIARRTVLLIAGVTGPN